MMIIKKLILTINSMDNNAENESPSRYKYCYT